MMIHRISHALLIGLFFFQTGLTQAVERQVTVMAPSVAIMDSPSTDRQEIGRVPKGSRLVVTGKRSGNWIQVQAPSSVSGWVYGELIRENLIAASSVKVRSGPGIGYGELATLRKGDPVVSQGRRGDWVEVACQPVFSAWVEQSMVSEGAVVNLAVVAESPAPPPVAPPVPPPHTPPQPPTPPQQPEETEPQQQATAAHPPSEVRPPPVAPSPPVTPPPAPVERVAVTVRPEIRPEPRRMPQQRRPKPETSVQPPVAAKPSPAVTVPVAARPPVQRPIRETVQTAAAVDPLQTLRLLPYAPQGHPIEVKGVLRSTGMALFAPSKYRLVAQDESDRPARTLCYVLSADRPLDDRLGQELALKGRKYWIYGCREPVIVIRDNP